MSSAATMRCLVPARDKQPTRRVADLIGNASIEISPRDDPADERLDQLLAPGMTVFVNHTGRFTHHDIIAACVKLEHAGFVPVPHVAARRLASFTQLRDFLRRATSEAGVKRVLLIAGDPAQAAGSFRDSLDLLETGLLEHHGIRDVAFACYPTGHPRIVRRDLDRSLRAKIASARRHGLSVSLVTQFGFEPGPIGRMITSLREDGIVCPIRVGVAGPAAVATLAKFAVRCGIGASLRALGSGEAAFARTLTVISPDALIESLATSEERASPIDGLHIFTFGGVRRAAAWLCSRGRA
jgi:methylenetetrahydrofolate reductase (NADPH)